MNAEIATTPYCCFEQPGRCYHALAAAEAEQVANGAISFVYRYSREESAAFVRSVGRLRDALRPLAELPRYGG